MTTEKICIILSDASFVESYANKEAAITFDTQIANLKKLRIV